MRIFLAGASGVIGRALIPLLLKAGHSVTGISRKDEGLAAISSLGAGARRCDALDAAALKQCVESVRPEAIICQLTDLPHELQPARLAAIYAANDRIRLEGTANLLAAAQACGVKRFILQSTAFWYSPMPPGPKDEGAPFYTDALEPIGRSAGVMTSVEGSVTSRSDMEGIAARYGSFYGPDTWYSRGGQVGSLVKKRMYPVIGKGEGKTSFIHVKDAATATIAIFERGRAGEAYNVVDDEPAAQNAWLPELASRIGAPPPMNMPPAVAKLTVGRAIVDWVTTGPGALNGKIRSELGWQPQYPSFREGFADL